MSKADNELCEAMPKTGEMLLGLYPLLENLNFIVRNAISIYMYLLGLTFCGCSNLI